MKIPKSSKGIAHPILLLLILLILLIGGFYAYTQTQAEQDIQIDNTEVIDDETGLRMDDASVAGASVGVPTNQIVSVPKSQCTLFVSKQGNNNSNGQTEGTAFASIAKGVSVMRPGDTLCVKGGSYREIVNISGKIGTASARYTIAGYAGGGLPIVDAGIVDSGEYLLPNPQCKNLDVCRNGSCHKNDPCRWQSFFSIVKSKYISLKGIDIRGSSGRGLQIGNSSYINIEGVRSYHNWGAGINIQGDAGDSNIHVDRSAFFDNSRAYPENGMIGGGAVHLHFVSDSSIRRSIVFENFGEGLDVGKDARDTLIEENLFWDNGHTMLYANGSVDASFNRNFLFCTGNRIKWMESNGANPNRTGSYGTAITVRNEKGVTSKHGEGGGTIVSNNTILGCTTGIVVAAQGDANLTDVKIFNNTIVSPRAYPSGGGYTGKSGSGITFGNGTSSNAQDIYFSNNVILADSSGTAIQGLNATSVKYANNIVSKLSGTKAGIKVADPKLSKNVRPDEKLVPANMDPANYVITAGSPAIGAAQTVANSRNLMNRDLFGNARSGSVHDAGSYKFGAAKVWPDVYGLVLGNTTDTPPDDGGGDDEEPPVGAVCGNGTVEQGEACDLGSSNGACPSECNKQCKVNSCEVDDGGEDEEEPPVSGVIDLNPALWKLKGTRLFTDTELKLINVKVGDTTLREVVLVKIPAYPSNGRVYIFQNTTGYDLKPNTDYTLKFKARAYGPVHPSFRVATTNDNITNRQEYAFLSEPLTVNNMWNTYSVKFKTPRKADAGQKMGIMILGEEYNRILLHEMQIIK